MASTNKTTNLQLSQFIGSDKPTYLGDYNSDMQKIDQGYKANYDNIATAIAGVESATSTANSAVASATQATSTANSASTTATQASTTANNAQSTANSALSTASTASAKADQVASDLNDFMTQFNLSEITVYQTGGTNNIAYTGSSGGTASGKLTLATNTEGTMFKLYGNINMTSMTRDGSLIFTIQTSLRPTEEYTIENGGYSLSNTSTYKYPRFPSITVKTNGEVEVFAYSLEGHPNQCVTLLPMLYFNSSFGDTPIPSGE